ncbi:MAG: hypothetical protein ABIH46_00165 [Chloroflexota bacterium]
MHAVRYAAETLIAGKWFSLEVIVHCKRLWLLSTLLCLTLLVTVACSSTPTPTATVKPTTTASPTATVPPKATTTARPTSSPTAKPTAQPTSTGTASSFTLAGKTVTLIVPYTPGGGTDVSGRAYAQFLGKYLPGKPQVIVRNMPGGETTIGVNYAYGTKPNGQTLLVAGGSVNMAQLLEKPALKVNLMDGTTVMGCVNADIYYFKPNVFDTPETIKNAKGIVYGHTSGATTVLFTMAVEMIGIPIDKLIMAYNSSGDARRAFLSGELTGTSETLLGYHEAVEPYVKKGEMKVLLQTGELDDKGEITRSGIWPDFYTAPELAMKVNGKILNDMAFQAYKSILLSSKAIDKPLLLPPGTPDNIKQAYWNATVQILKDPDFIKLSKNIIGDTTWYAGQSFDQMWHKTFGMTPEVRDWLREFLKNKYGAVLE